MPLLTQSKVMNDIAEFQNEWKNEDWIYGSTYSYNNAVHGYDVSVLHDEDTNKIEAVVYELFRDDVDELVVGEVLFKFDICGK
jgi:hypothetical protein